VGGGQWAVGSWQLEVAAAEGCVQLQCRAQIDPRIDGKKRPFPSYKKPGFMNNYLSPVKPY